MGQIFFSTMDKKIPFIFCFLFFSFLYLSASAQEPTREDACREYENILAKVDTTFAQMRACDSAMAEIQDRISKGDISEQNEILMYQEIVEIKKQKVLLESKLKKYGVLAKQLEYHCKND